MEEYSEGKEYLRKAGVSTEGLSEFYISGVMKEISLEDPDLCARTVSCTDGKKELVYVLTFDDEQGSNAQPALLHQLTLDRPSAPYTTIDKGYGEKEYKVYRLSDISRIKIRNGNLYGVVSDISTISDKEPSSGVQEDGSISFSTSYRTEYDNCRILLNSKARGDVLINFADASGIPEYLPADDGVFYGNIFYGLDGKAQYEVYEYTRWGQFGFYYDENVSYHRIGSENSGFWFLQYSGSQFLGVQIGVYNNPTKATLTNAYGPLVAAICIEDMKEGAYCWRSNDYTGDEDNNRYESIVYSGKSGDIFKWKIDGTSYSGSKFTYTLAIDAKNQTVSLTDQSGQTVSMVNDFTCGYTQHR